MSSRLRHRVGVIVGFLFLHRWPWPVWKLRGAGTLPIGPHTFRFHALAERRLVWWAHQARRRRWEPAVIGELARALRPGDVFVDLGAFVGPFTLLASRIVGPAGRVVAFEPDPGARELLEHNLAANGVGNVTVVPHAVGARADTVRFFASGDSIGRIGAAGNLEVRQVALDEYCAEHSIRPTVMKVDIEGGEAAALQGSAVARQLRELVLEIHEPELREQGVDPRSFLAGLGEHELLEPPDSGNYGVLVRPRSTA